MPLRLALIIGLVLGNVLGLLALPLPTQAVSGTVVISELATGGAGTGHASDEFVELYNASPSPVSLNKWTLKYRAASTNDCSTGWSKTLATLGDVTIAPGGFYLLATTYLTTADIHFSAGLSATAGAVRVADGTGQVIDTLGWGNVNSCSEGAFAAAAGDGHSLERRPGLDSPTAGNGTDTDDNASDFMVRTVAEPQSSAAPVELPSADDLLNLGPTTYLPLEITELLVDPVSPQTDAADEFIELHNANTEPVQVNNYAVTTSSGSYHLPPAILQPDAYLVATSASSHLSLSNSGGMVSLLDPTGSEVDETAAWGVAVPGATWALATSGWDWTTTPTPGAANIMTAVPDPASDPVTGSGDASPSAGLATYLPLVLNELLPNPAAPASDDTDEFVELYNPNAEAVDAQNYVIKTGSSLGNTVTLPEGVVPPGGYLAITSGASSLTLSNAGSKVELLDPAGAQLGDIITYGEAAEGEAYALGANGWGWTTTPTPGAPNIMTVPVVAVKKAATKTTKAKASPKPKVVKAKATKTKAAKKTTKKTTKPLVAAAAHSSGSWLLFGLAALTIGYVIYEFRYDLLAYYHRLRGHARLRRSPR